MTESLALARRAEGLGYTDAWTAEVGGADGFAPLAALAVQTETMRLGTAIVPAYTRPPALLAMSAATLQNISHGRFVLGLGTSSAIIVERWMGGTFDNPLTRLTEYVHAVGSALDGDRVTFTGSTISLTDFRLQIELSARVPLYMAALGARACRAAGAVADGVIFFLKTPHGVTQALDWVAEGARSAGRDPSLIDAVIRLPVILGDVQAMRPAAQRLLAGYAMVDAYNRSLSLQGFDTEARRIAGSWHAGDRKKAAAAVTTAMTDELLLAGDTARCRERIDEFRAAGITTPVLFPLAPSGDAGETTLAAEALAP